MTGLFYVWNLDNLVPRGPWAGAPARWIASSAVRQATGSASVPNLSLFTTIEASVERLRFLTSVVEVILDFEY